MTLRKEDHLFGRLALHYRLVTREQVNEALRQQSREGGRRKVGEILLERGWLTRERFEQLLKVQQQVQEQSRGPTRTEAPAQPSVEPREPAEPAGAGPDAGAPAAPEPAEPPEPEPAGASAAPSGGPSAVAAEPSSPPEEAPAPTTDEPASLAHWLRYAAGRGASDLHVHAGQRVRLRIHGELEASSPEPLPPERAETLLRGALTVAQKEELDRTGQVEVAESVADGGRYRGSIYRHQKGVDGVFRLIPPRPPSLSDLDLPLDLARFANFHQGLVLVTGPAGCGKSATLAALVDIVNRERPDHVITIEDPVEVVHGSDRSIVNQRQVGRHTRSFDRALRAALREDPDVIVVGELRDLETISLALTAAETGHLVLATLHTTSAISTINRLVGVFPPNQQPQIRAMASESLRAIVCQRLARRADGRGRVPALEILVGTNAVSNLIRDNKAFQIRSVLQTGTAQGMRTLDASLEELVSRGTITRDEARLHAESPERFGGGKGSGQGSDKKASAPAAPAEPTGTGGPAPGEAS